MKTRKGFTVLELLVSLAIMAVLMSAVAVAFNASAVSYNENKEMYDTLNSARMALVRMTSQLRTARSVQPVESAIQCSFQADDGSFAVFRWDSLAKKLKIDSGGNSYVLCENVTLCNFSRQTAVSGGITYVKNVQISLRVGNGNNAQTVSAAVVLRKTI